MKFRAPTIVFNAFWKAGLIFGSAFCLGFFAWPWVAYGAITLETFEGYTLGNLNGQSSWASDGAQVVSTGGTKAITLDGYEYARKNYNVLSYDIFAIDILPGTYLPTGEYNFIRFCNGLVTDCTGEENAGFVISIAGESTSDKVNIFNHHSTGLYDTLALNIPTDATSTLYFAFYADKIGFSYTCETIGCSFPTMYSPYYASSTIDDIDGLIIEANSGTYDIYYDNIRTVAYEDVYSDEPVSGSFANPGSWTFGDAFSYLNPKCQIGYPCYIEIKWSDDNNENVASLMSENRVFTYDSVWFHGYDINYDTFTVPASTTPGYATFDILIENINGYYTDEYSSVGYKVFENVFVEWSGSIDPADTWSFLADCGEVCDDIPTTTAAEWWAVLGEGWWEHLGDEMNCGFRKLVCWGFKPDESVTNAFKKLSDTSLSIWPFSLISQITDNVYKDGDTGVIVVTDDNATTTLNAATFFPTGTAPITILSNKLYSDSEYSGMEALIVRIKDKISFLLYAILFFYVFVRIMGSAWLPNPSTRPHPQSEQIKKAFTANHREKDFRKGTYFEPIDLRRKY